MYATPQFFHAKADGVTDDSAAIQAALNSGSPVYFPPGIYLCSGIVIPLGSTITGEGSLSVIKTLSDAPIFSIGYPGSGPTTTGPANIQIRNLSFLGTNPDEVSQVNQHAIDISTYGGVLISECYFKDINGAGIHARELTDFNPDRIGFQVSNCRFTHSRMGVFTDTRGEFGCFSGNTFKGCTKAFRIGAGSTSIVGGSIEGNSVGIEILPGINDSHGICSGVHINHNATNILASGTVENRIVNGFTFAGCHIYEGAIYLCQMDGVSFNGGQIDVNLFQFEGSRGTRFDAVRLPGGYANEIQHDFNGTVSTSGAANCVDLLGASKNSGLSH